MKGGVALCFYFIYFYLFLVCAQLRFANSKEIIGLLVRVPQLFVRCAVCRALLTAFLQVVFKTAKGAYGVVQASELRLCNSV